MTAANHALTGALIGLTIANPVIALPLAFLSHLALDAIPHYDQAETDLAKRIDSRRFLYDYILLGASLCFLLVVLLALTRPRHWLSAVICAFLATSMDLFWIPRYIHVKRTKQDIPLRNWFLHLHHSIQWRTGPKLIWVEAVWFVVIGGLVARHL